MASEATAEPPVQPKSRVVVVGGGFGGLEVCAQLDGKAEELGIDITLIDASSSFFVGLAGQLILQGHATRDECELSYERLSFRHVAFVQAQVTSVDVVERTLTTSQDSTFSFDYLVLATGLTPNKAAVPHLADPCHWICSPEEILKLRETLSSFRGGTILAVLPVLPEKCPPAIYEYAFIIDGMLRASEDPDLRQRSKLVIATQRPNAVPEMSPQRFNDLCREKGIDQEFCVQMTHVESSGGSGTAFFKGVARRAGESLAVPFDVLLGHVPYQGASDFVPSASTIDVNAKKLIVADFSTMRTLSTNVWALGDCAHLVMPVGKPCPKAGGFALVQGNSVGRQILRSVSNGLDRLDAQSDAAWGPEAADPADLLGDEDEVVCASEVGGGLGVPIHINLWNSQKKPRFTVDEPSPEGLRSMWHDWADIAERWFTLPDGYRGLHKV